MTVMEVVEWLKNNVVLGGWIAAISTLAGLSVRYLNRRRAIVHAIRTVGPHEYTIAIDVESVGDKPTSLLPNLCMVGYSPKRVRNIYAFRIDGNDRQLDSHKQKTFIACHSDQHNDMIHYLWYITFTIPVTRGLDINLRYRNIGFERLTIFQFYWGLFQFKLFGYIS